MKPNANKKARAFPFCFYHVKLILKKNPNTEISFPFFIGILILPIELKYKNIFLGEYDTQHSDISSDLRLPQRPPNFADLSQTISAHTTYFPQP